jgi:hypothetical protein
MYHRIRVALLLALLVGVSALQPLAPARARAPLQATPDCPITGHLISGPTLNRDPSWQASALQAVSAVGPGNVWALGNYITSGTATTQATAGPLLEHWTGTEWQRVSIPNAATAQYPSVNLDALVTLNAQDIWIGGTAYDYSAGPSQQKPVLEHGDGTHWSLVPVPPRSAGLQLAALAASGPADIWVLEAAEGQNRAFHGEGRTWQETALPVPPGGTPQWRWLRAFAADDAWLAGVTIDPTLHRETGVLLAHWDGYGWFLQSIGKLPPYTQMMQVTGVSSHDIWAVGNINGPPGPIPTATASLTPGAGATPPELAGVVFLHWDGVQWSRVPAPAAYFIQGLSFTRADDGWASGIVNGSSAQYFGLLHWDGLRWTPVPVADAGHDSYPNSYPDVLRGAAAEAPDDLWAVGASHISGPQQQGRMSIVHIFRDCAVPTARASDPQDPAVTYFPPTGHTLRGVFRDYWTAHGGLAQFGYPLTDEFPERNPTDGRVYTVQYFERNRFELHPENAGTPYVVLLGLLGRSLAATLPLYQQAFQPLRQAPPGTRFFPATGHSLAPEFRAYWEQHGGLAVYGYPISEPFEEVSATDSKTYLVQYFERNRLELHPELPAEYRVSLGLLGVDLLRSRGWLP